jgi:hypothetical protein
VRESIAFTFCVLCNLQAVLPAQTSSQRVDYVTAYFQDELAILERSHQARLVRGAPPRAWAGQRSAITNSEQAASGIGEDVRDGYRDRVSTRAEVHPACSEVSDTLMERHRTPSFRESGARSMDSIQAIPNSRSSGSAVPNPSVTGELSNSLGGTALRRIYDGAASSPGSGNAGVRQQETVSGGDMRVDPPLLDMLSYRDRHDRVAWSLARSGLNSSESSSDQTKNLIQRRGSMYDPPASGRRSLASIDLLTAFQKGESRTSRGTPGRARTRNELPKQNRIPASQKGSDANTPPSVRLLRQRSSSLNGSEAINSGAISALTVSGNHEIIRQSSYRDENDLNFLERSSHSLQVATWTSARFLKGIPARFGGSKQEAAPAPSVAEE